MRSRWPLPGNEYLLDNGEEWLLNVLANCSDEVRDMIIMLVWRVWQVRTDLTHGKEAAPVEVSVEFLDSYFRSIQQANKYRTEEIVK